MLDFFWNLPWYFQIPIAWFSTSIVAFLWTLLYVRRYIKNEIAERVWSEEVWKEKVGRGTYEEYKNLRRETMLDEVWFEFRKSIYFSIILPPIQLLRIVGEYTRSFWTWCRKVFKSMWKRYIKRLIP